MLPTRVLAAVGLLATGFGLTETTSADTYFVIIRGKVTMEDGSPPPFTVGVERVCSDVQGSAPGPIINKKGEYTWRMEMDTFNSRSCVIRATHAGYASTGVDASGINATSTTRPPPFRRWSYSRPSRILTPLTVRTAICRGRRRRHSKQP